MLDVQSGMEFASIMRPLSIKTRLIFFCCVAFFLWLRPITVVGAYEAIEIGMTEAQVMRIMTLPPGEYYSSPECCTIRMVHRMPAPGRKDLCWYFDECGVTVCLDNGRVSDKFWQSTSGP